MPAKDSSARTVVEIPEQDPQPPTTRPAGRPVAGRARAIHERHPELLPALLLVGLAIVANLPYLIGWFNPNPLNQLSGLGTTTKAGLLPGFDAIDPNSGLTSQALGHLAAVDWRHGIIPWWNHNAGVGAPLAGGMQSAALFPLVLLLGYSNGQVFFHLSLEVVAALATYFLIRRVTTSRLAAWAGGAAFCLNGTVAWLGHAPSNPIAFLPVLLLGIEKSRDATVAGRRRGWALVAIGLAFSLYAGFPETAYIDTLFAGLWTLIRIWQLPRREVVRFLGKVITGVVVGLLLAAPILVAFFDYLPHAYTGGHNGFFGHVSLVPASLPMTVLPYVYGPIFGFSPYDATGALAAAWGSIGGYLTTGLLVLAVIGLFGRRHRPLRILLAAWIVVALARTFGVSIASAVVNAVPQMGNTAFYRYAPVSWELAVVVLAALGIDDIAAGDISALRRAAAAVVALLATVLLALDSLPLLHHLVGAPHHRVWALASAGWGAAVVVAVAVAALLIRGRARTVALTALLVMDVLIMFLIPQLSAPRRTSFDAKPVAFLRSHLGTARFFTLGPLIPNYGSYFGLASAGDTDVPLPKLWTDYLTKNLDTNVDPIIFTGTTQANSAGPSPAQEFVTHFANYEAIGVKYLLLPRGMNLPPPGPGFNAHQVFSDEKVQILELSDPKPYFEDPSGRCQVTIINRDKVQASCPAPATIERRELFMAGWHATVNGRSIPVTLQDHLFQAVSLPAGTATVDFHFEPPYMTLALGALLMGVLALVVPQGADRLLGRRRGARR
jgi:hypothetical protein